VAKTTWSVPFAEIARRQKSTIERVVRASTLEVFKRVIMRSPVDTGRFRANWNASYNALDELTTGRKDPDGAATINRANRAVLSYPIGGVMYLSNSLPYAVVLEYGLYPNPPIRGSIKRRDGETAPTVHVTGGYSNQAPQGMVRLTAREFAEAVQRSLREPSS
jgi:hypothetical protein